MARQKERAEFEISKDIRESTLLTFRGVDGYDVYNTSVPFRADGKTYLFGRVERRDLWADSRAMLFEETGKDEYTLVPGARSYEIEDPFVFKTEGEYILGGTRVRKVQNAVSDFRVYFYRGTDIRELHQFTTGPVGMKDIRILPFPDGRIGVFTRPRSEEIRRRYGHETLIGYVDLEGIDSLRARAIVDARNIADFYRKEEWGGANQVFFLKSGRIGIIGHLSEKLQDAGEVLDSYMNVAFTFDPKTWDCTDPVIIGTRACYPAAPHKAERLTDCAFTSGITPSDREGFVNLYSGICDTCEGRIVIPDPFAAEGGVIWE